ncbi:MAG TPA: hypothetical protein VM286_05625 [Candidatus Thermoplasmatota archaeon]|nr:hypothetical protein [Candidatus Thermoplasmatota archaeon]
MSSFLGGSGTPAELVWSVYVLLGTLLLVFAGWRVVGRLASRHRDADPRAPTKALVALVAALVLGIGGFLLLAQFEARSEQGIHTTFVKAVNQTVGEGDYIENMKTAASKPEAIRIQQTKLAEANAAYAADPSPANRDTRDQLAKAVNQTRDDLAKAQANLLLLAPNHQVWLLVQPHLAAGTDAEDEKARAILDKALDPAQVAGLPGMGNLACTRDKATGQCTSNTPVAITHTFRDLHTLSDVPVAQGVPEAYEHKHEYRAQMQSMLAWFVYPGITGLFMAPFAFAGGSILNAAYEPSDTVGFKPYPGKAAGWFLVLGAFGLFAIPFAAWTLRDLSRRSAEGQINL